MIIVKLQGGLGNQMFQYAMGRSLSIKNNTKLLLDTREYDRKNFRTYELGNFSINAKVANLIDRLNPFNTHVIGYFQSEQYFKSIEKIIRKEFQLKNINEEKLNPYLSEIKNTESVSLHIRRTDYLATKNQKVYLQIPLEYYSKAIEKIRTTLGITNDVSSNKLKVFVFSDDIDWVRNNLKIPFDIPIKFVSGNGFSNSEELYLMTQCKHNITANSTFSWWSAWLNTNPQKIVTTPQKWFVEKNKEETGLIPSSWIKL
ncbi:MAG: alpha-1,2-fucosyltransferase [Candidatus Paceibacterota bacterium]